MKNLPRISAYLFWAAALAAISGCSKLTFERWQTLTLQSSKSEVEAVLGTPNDVRTDTRWRWHDPDEQITCTAEFIGGDLLTYSQWVDPRHGRHTIGTPEIENGNLIRRETGTTKINP